MSQRDSEPLTRASSSRASSGNSVYTDADDTPNRNDSHRNNHREDDQGRYGGSGPPQHVPTHPFRPQGPSKPNIDCDTAEAPTFTVSNQSPTRSESVIARTFSEGRDRHDLPQDALGLQAQQLNGAGLPSMQELIYFLERHAYQALSEGNPREARCLTIVAQLAEWTQCEESILINDAFNPASPPVTQAFDARFATIKRNHDSSVENSQSSTAPVRSSGHNQKTFRDSGFEDDIAAFLENDKAKPVFDDGAEAVNDTHEEINCRTETSGLGQTSPETAHRSKQVRPTDLTADTDLVRDISQPRPSRRPQPTLKPRAEAASTQRSTLRSHQNAGISRRQKKGFEEG